MHPRNQAPYCSFSRNFSPVKIMLPIFCTVVLKIYHVHTLSQKSFPSFPQTHTHEHKACSEAPKRLHREIWQKPCQVTLAACSAHPGVKYHSDCRSLLRNKSRSLLKIDLLPNMHQQTRMCLLQQRG